MQSKILHSWQQITKLQRTTIRIMMRMSTMMISSKFMWRVARE